MVDDTVGVVDMLGPLGQRVGARQPPLKSLAVQATTSLD